MRTWLVVIAAVIACGLLIPGMATAGSLGVYCWQLGPFDDEICVDLDDGAIQAGFLEARGTQFEPGGSRRPIIGGITFDEKSGTLRFFWTGVCFSFDGCGGGPRPITFRASLNPVTLEGPWGMDDDPEIPALQLLFLGPASALSNSTATP